MQFLYIFISNYSILLKYSVKMGNNSFKNAATICKGLKNSLSKCRSCMDNFREGRTPHVSPRRGRYNYIPRVEHYKFVDQY
jgi:hypothetical protein